MDIIDEIFYSYQAYVVPTTAMLASIVVQFVMLYVVEIGRLFSLPFVLLCKSCGIIIIRLNRQGVPSK